MSRYVTRATLLMPSPPAGPVPAMIILRTSCGSISTISCAIMPPIENPKRSTRSKPIALMNVMASVAICSIEVAGGRADASIVERDHVVLRRETVDNSRIPVVEDGSQVDQEHHRGAGIVRPELPIRELHSAGGDRPRGDVLPTDLQVLRRTHDSLTETMTLPFARPAST